MNIVVSNVNEGAYIALSSRIPNNINEALKKKLDIRAKVCSSCVNFSKLGLFCSKCGCVEQNSNSFIDKKFLDMSYGCPLKYW